MKQTTRSFKALAFAATVFTPAASFAGNGFLVHKDGGTAWTEQSSLANALSTLGTGPGEILLPAGEHTITSTITLYGKQKLTGTGGGTVIKTTNIDLTMIALATSTSPGDIVSLEDLGLLRDCGNSNWADVDGIAIETNGRDALKLSGVSISNNKYALKDSSTTDPSLNLNILDCYFENVSDSFLRLDAAAGHTGMVVQKSLFQYSGGYGIVIKGPTSGTGMNWIGPAIISTCENAVAKLYYDNFFLTGCNFGASQSNVLELVDCKDFKITDSYLSAAGFTVNTPATWSGAITVDWSTKIADMSGLLTASANPTDDLTVTGCTVSYNTGNGITINGGSNVTLADNKVHSNSRYSSGANKADIQLGSSFKSIIVKGNRTYNDLDLVPGEPWQYYGLRVNGSGSDYLLVDGNNFKDLGGGQAGGGLSINTSPTNYLAGDNQ